LRTHTVQTIETLVTAIDSVKYIPYKPTRYTSRCVIIVTVTSVVVYVRPGYAPAASINFTGGGV